MLPCSTSPFISLPPPPPRRMCWWSPRPAPARRSSPSSRPTSTCRSPLASPCSTPRCSGGREAAGGRQAGVKRPGVAREQHRMLKAAPSARFLSQPLGWLLLFCWGQPPPPARAPASPQLANVLSTEQLFYTCIFPFIAFFGAFAFVLYPMRDALHPTGERSAAQRGAAGSAGRRRSIVVACAGLWEGVVCSRGWISGGRVWYAPLPVKGCCMDRG